MSAVPLPFRGGSPSFGNVDLAWEDRTPRPSASKYRSNYSTLGVTFVDIVTSIESE